MNHRPTRLIIVLLTLFAIVLSASSALAALEWEKRAAIDHGLVWLATNQSINGDLGYWSYSNDGTLACTAAAALAFIEEDFLPGEDVVIDDINYGDVVGFALNYVFNHAVADSRFGVEYAVYERYAEDYDNDGIYDDGNDQAIYFDPGNPNRRVYTTGICVPMVFALGERLGINTVIGRGSAVVSGMTYAEAMQDLIDWFCFAQVEPNRGNYRGGWRYDANYPDSDNSTAQWGSLPLLYGDSWGLGAPDYVFAELELWVNYIQNANGGSGYSNPGNYVNVAKTGGLLLELAAIGAPVSDARVQAAIGFINGRWNTGPSGTWYGNLNHPYAMWAVFKGLEVYDLMDTITLDDLEILFGFGMSAAPGGFPIGTVDDFVISESGDWYSHYCDYLVGIQNGDGGWNGYLHWVGAMATGWYINILDGIRVPGIGNPAIRLVSEIPDACANPGDPVLHTAAFWYGTPGFPDPDTLPAENVEVLLTLNQHMTFVAASDGGTYDVGAHTVTWSIGELADGEVDTVTVDAVVAGTAPADAELITEVDVSATNVQEEDWGHDETEVLTCVSTCVWNVATDVVERGATHGVAWGDYDNDQDPDLLVTGSGLNHLYENVDGVLVMVEGWCEDEEPSYGAAWADYDNDGDLDVYVVNSLVANALYNNDAGVFTRVAAGDAEDAGDGYNAAWADFDGDGDLDLYICNRDGTNRLLENDGGMFTSVGGVTEYTGITRGCAFADYDNDDDPDLYISVYGDNMLFRNDGGVFVDVSAPPMNDGGEGKGVAWADYDNDGDLDLYLVNTHGANKLFRNDLDAGFVDVTDALLGDENNGRTCAWADYDNDGWMDLFFTNITSGRNILIENDEGVFTDANCGVLEDTATLESWGCAFADYDGDGDQDLAMAVRTLNGPSKVFRNDLTFGEPANWLQIDLRGVANNRFGVGARIVVDTGEQTLMRAVNANGAYLGQQPLTASFGLGAATHVDLTVHWPNGEVQTLANLPVNRRLEIVEAAGAVGVDELPTSPLLTVTNYPNPFNPSTTLEFSLPRSAEVELKVLDARGRLVRTLLAGETMVAGVHRVRWQGGSDSGRDVPSGVYFYRCGAGGEVVTGRMVLLK